MTKTWTNNILSSYFSNKAENSTPTSQEQKIISAAKPFARFFESIGFKQSDISGIVSYLRIANGRINLHVAPTSLNDDGKIDSLTISLSMEKSGEVRYEHPLKAQISVNEKGEGRYTLSGGETNLVSGDPRKIINAFVLQTEKPLQTPLMAAVNREYRPTDRGQLTPIF